VKICRLAIIVQCYAMLELGVPLQQFNTVVSEAHCADSSPWVSYDPSNSVWNTRNNNKATLWKLQMLIKHYKGIDQSRNFERKAPISLHQRWSWQGLEIVSRVPISRIFDASTAC
jgi:hypothetical protein